MVDFHRLMQQRADRQRMILERGRLSGALLLSLLIHALLLGLTFGGGAGWLPGIGFPWQERRFVAPELRVVVVPPQVTAEEPPVAPVAELLPQARVEPPVASGPALTPPVSRAPTPRPTTAAIVRETHSITETPLKKDAPIVAASTQTPLPAERTGDTAPPPIPPPAVIAVPRIDESAPDVPVAPVIPTPDIGLAPSVSIPETAMPSLRDPGVSTQARVDEEKRGAEPAKPDPSKQEAQRRAEQREAEEREQARREAARQAAAHAENARLEAARQEATRQEAERQAAAQQKMAQQEATRQEAERQKAAQQEAARQEGARQDAARQEAARQEAARQEAARQKAAQVEAAQDAEAKREARLRAIGRQLDEEADKRDAAKAAARESPSLPYSYSSPRRYRLFGRADPNAEIILYAEAWARKIEMNMTIDMVRDAAKQPYTDPLVTVAMRSDGSVESVTFIRSSGVAAIDDAIRRIVDSQRPYQAFAPALAREYDVIEIRRSWHFDVGVRLY